MKSTRILRSCSLLLLIVSPFTQGADTSYIMSTEPPTEDYTTISHVLDTHGTHITKQSSIILDHSLEEIEFDQNGLLPYFSNYTTTESGSMGMMHLMQPTNDTDRILRRQQSIHSLVHNPEARETIHAALRDIQESEAYLASYFESESEQAEQIGHDLYYDMLQHYFPSLNYSPTALGVGVHIAPCCGIATSLTMTLLPSWSHQAQSYSYRLLSAWQENEFSFRTVIPSYAECSEAVRNGSSIYFQYLSPFARTLADPSRYDIVQEGIETGDPTSVARAIGTYSGTDLEGPIIPSAGDDYYLFSLMTGYKTAGTVFALSHYIWSCYNALSIYQQYSILSQRYKSIQQLHHIASHVARIVKRARDIEQIVSTYMPELLEDELPRSQFITREEYTDDACQQLDELLSSHTFEERTKKQNRAPHLRKPRNRYSTGKVLTTHQLLTDNPHALLPVMEYIGIIDALTGLADMYEAHKNIENRYCFTTFDTERTTPYVYLENFWTPLIPANKAVGNDFTLDTTNAIFTGPNGIGKSTAMKGIAHSIMLAQCVGIAPASTAHISLFDYINTYLNIRENTQEGLSSFMAEKKRIDTFYEEAPHITGNTLYLVDEPFRGTFAEEAEKRVTSFGEFIDQYPNIMMLMATHFEKPTTLDHEHRYANYHIGIDERADGSFYLTHRVHPGTLDWWFTDPEKRSRFVDWISDYMAEKAAQP